METEAAVLDKRGNKTRKNHSANVQKPAHHGKSHNQKIGELKDRVEGLENGQRKFDDQLNEVVEQVNTELEKTEACRSEIIERINEELLSVSQSNLRAVEEVVCQVNDELEKLEEVKLSMVIAAEQAAMDKIESILEEEMHNLGQPIEGEVVSNWLDNPKAKVAVGVTAGVAVTGLVVLGVKTYKKRQAKIEDFPF